MSLFMQIPLYLDYWRLVRECMSGNQVVEIPQFYIGPLYLYKFDNQFTNFYKRKKKALLGFWLAFHWLHSSMQGGEVGTEKYIL